MSRNNTVHNGTFFSYKLLRTAGPQLGACTLVSIFLILTVSCALIGQNGGQSNGNTPQNLTITGTLPAGMTSQAYNSVLTINGGSAPYQFWVKSGSLPPGMSLNPATGSISGTPTHAGSYPFQIAATDLPNSHQGSQDFTISVGNSGGIHISVTPSNANIVSGHTQTFTATVTGTNNTGASWSCLLYTSDAADE